MYKFNSFKVFDESINRHYDVAETVTGFTLRALITQTCKINILGYLVYSILGNRPICHLMFKLIWQMFWSRTYCNPHFSIWRFDIIVTLWGYHFQLQWNFSVSALDMLSLCCLPLDIGFSVLQVITFCVYLYFIQCAIFFVEGLYISCRQS